MPDLQAQGPVVAALLEVGDKDRRLLDDAGLAVPSPLEIHAVIDTGASNTVLKVGLASRLNLTRVGTTYISTPSSARFECPEYVVRLALPNDVGFQLPVIEAPLEGQDVECMIGRDILAQAVLVYIGFNNQFTLSF